MKTPQTIVNELISVLDEYKTSLDNYSDAVFSHKTDEDTWSLAQMYEHVCSSSQKFFLANTKRCLEQRNGQEGGEPNQHGKQFMALGAFPNIKIKVPEAVKTEIIPNAKETYYAELEIIKTSAAAMQNAVEADAGTYRINHPAFGFINAHEWFLNLEMHSRHHLRQKTELENLATNA